MKTCSKCESPVLPGTGQKFCAEHKLTRDGASQSAMSQRAARYNLKIEDLEAMHVAQDDRCAICGRTEPIETRSLVVDHDHRCCPGVKSCGKCVRGLICSSCNRALGLMGDDPNTLAAAAAYLGKKY